MSIAPDPVSVFDRMCTNWVQGRSAFGHDDLAADVVIETPFSPPGARRFAGRQQWLDFAGPQQAELPLHIDDCRTTAVHRTADPEVVVVEYQLAATLATTGHRARAAFVGVLRVRDGSILQWREYQNVLALSMATGTLPQVVQAYSAAILGDTG